MVLAPIVTLETAKMYLRVDTSDEDALISILLASAEQMVMDVARIGHAEWNEIQRVTADDERNVSATNSNACSKGEIVQLRELLKIAILYAVGYLYEHREEADHHGLMLTLRNLLFAVREGVL